MVRLPDGDTVHTGLWRSDGQTSYDSIVCTMHSTAWQKRVFLNLLSQHSTAVLTVVRVIIAMSLIARRLHLIHSYVFINYYINWRHYELDFIHVSTMSSLTSHIDLLSQPWQHLAIDTEKIVTIFQPNYTVIKIMICITVKLDSKARKIYINKQCHVVCWRTTIIMHNILANKGSPIRPDGSTR